MPARTRVRPSHRPLRSRPGFYVYGDNGKLLQVWMQQESAERMARLSETQDSLDHPLEWLDASGLGSQGNATQRTEIARGEEAGDWGTMPRVGSLRRDRVDPLLYVCDVCGAEVRYVDGAGLDMYGNYSTPEVQRCEVCDRAFNSWVWRIAF